MASVVFLRAANVGKHNRFQPGLFVRQLSSLGAINIGAVGTFVITKDVTEKTLRSAVLRNLPIKCDVMICPAREIVDLVRNNPLKDEQTDKDRRVFLTIMAQAPAKLPRLPIYAPAKKDWEVSLVWMKGTLVLSLWRRLRENALYPNQIIEKQFAVKTTTRTWGTIEKVGKILATL